MTALLAVRRWSMSLVAANLAGRLLARVLMSRHMRSIDPAETDFPDTEPEQEEHV